MTTIELQTRINAPIQVCFDLSRSVDLHQVSTARSHEKVLEGRLTGLCCNDDEITWRAKHFGVYQDLKVRVALFKYPVYFEDYMVKGAFRSMRHQHYFREAEGITTMYDIFKYEVPYGILGKMFDALVLKRYMTQLLAERNKVIKEYAETGKWRDILS